MRWIIVTYPPGDAICRPYACQKCGDKQAELLTASAFVSANKYF